MRKSIAVLMALPFLLGYIANFNAFAIEMLQPEIRNFTPKDYKANKQNHSITQDLRGIIYVANNDGILEYDSISWRLIRLPGNVAAYSLFSHKGRVYVGGTGEFGYLEPDASGSMKYISLKGLLGAAFKDFEYPIIRIHSTPRGMVFLSEKHLFLVKGDDVKVYSTEEHFYSSVFDGKNLYVLDGDRGLARLGMDRLESIPGGDFFRSQEMMSFPGNKILIVTQSKGLLLYDSTYVAKNRWEGRRAFKKLSRSRDNFFSGQLFTSGISLNSEMYLLGAITKGVVVIDGKGKKQLQLLRQNGLLSNDVYHVYKDFCGNIWLSLNNGITQLIFNDAPATKRKIKAEKAASVNLKEKSENEQESSTEDKKVDKAPIQTGPPPFSSLVRSCETLKEGITLFGGTFFNPSDKVPGLMQAISLRPIIEYENSDLRFSYASNQYGQKGQVQFQTQLEGQDEDWSKWSDRTYREYTNLHWRDFIFKVRAKHADGTVSNESRFYFEILPPWYETWWFYSSVLTFLALMVVIAGFLRGLSNLANRFADQLVAIVVLVLFVYLDTQTEDYIEDFAADVLYIKIGLMVLMGVMIEPFQNFVSYMFQKLDLDYRALTNNTTDRLTNLENQYGLNKKVKKVFKNIKDYESVSLMIIDVDLVEQMKKAHGKRYINSVIRVIAKIIKENQQENQFSGRIAKDKFVNAYTHLSPQEVLDLGRKICKEVLDHDFKYESKQHQVTVSIGIASYPVVCEENPTYYNLLEEMGKALEFAKVSGRGKVISARFSGDEEKEKAEVKA